MSEWEVKSALRIDIPPFKMPPCVWQRSAAVVPISTRLLPSTCGLCFLLNEHAAVLKRVLRNGVHPAGASVVLQHLAPHPKWALVRVWAAPFRSSSLLTAQETQRRTVQVLRLLLPAWEAERSSWQPWLMQPLGESKAHQIQVVGLFL